MDSVDMLRQYIENSDNIVFFGGAGVSTESGIPDFRSVDGLYHEKYDYPPETILSRSFFNKNPEAFYRFYRDKLVVRNAAPNPAHIRLAELETQGKLKAVITQNIDGLHQAAGSKNVIELHGSTQRCNCSKCGRQHDPALLNEGVAVPRCSYCGGVLQPDVVLYEDQLDSEAIASAIHYIRHADVLIIGGTSLVVYPAAGLINYYRGNKLVLINKSTTSQDSSAALVIREKIGEVFSRV
ncbi:MAG: NAD-dependent protein deacylase [Ruminococcaceae bacterium]|nr:NAD-dependent protein deacylase [Oscillospiraceae bacterium]